MVFILHRYLIKELLRIFVLASLALTLILSVGLLVPIIREYGVSPEKILHLIGYFLPITFTFVMPISALFASAMVYGRFAADRELDACRASGIRFRSIIYPGLCLALIVSVSNLLLSFYVTPAFVERAEKSIKADAKQILFRKIQKQGFYELPGDRYRIYAEQAILSKSLLQDVIILDTEQGSPQKMITAREARIEIQTHHDYNLIRVIAKDVFRIEEKTLIPIGNLDLTQRFASLLADNIKFKKVEQLKRIQTNKMNFGPIYDLAMKARAQFALERLAEEIHTTVESSDDHYILQSSFHERECELNVTGCEIQKRRIDLVGPIQLLEINKFPKSVHCSYDCDFGRIGLDDDSPDSGMELILKTPRWRRSSTVSGTSMQKVISDLPLPETVAKGLESQNVIQTIMDLGTDPSLLSVEPSPILKELQEQLLSELIELDNRILAELHSRLVLGLGCIVLILTGICLGIRFRGGHVLSAFGASAIPAGVLIIFILAGKELTKNDATPAAVGVGTMWLGLGLLTVLAIWFYRKQASI